MNSPGLFGILGHGISYSLSPYIFNTIFRRRRMNCLYMPFDVSPEDLRKFIRSVKIVGLSGFNVTVPYKVRIMRYLDDLHSSAQSVGAANLVVSRNGELVGYNADSYGIKQTIEEYLEFRVNNRHVLLIGAGGAARAAIEYLREAEPGTVILINRNLNRARRMRDILQMPDTRICNLREIDGCIEDQGIDLIINATPMASASFLKSIPSGLRIFDMSYKSGGSPYGKSRMRCDGKYMLAAQASRSISVLCRARIEVDEIFRLIRRL